MTIVLCALAGLLATLGYGATGPNQAGLYALATVVLSVAVARLLLRRAGF